MSAIANLPLIVSQFPTAMPKAKEAYGNMVQKRWGDLRNMLFERREGPKDGPNLVFARFKIEGGKFQAGDPQKQIVRRLKDNLEARTAIALDVDGNKETGEVAPPLGDISDRITAQGWAALLYTSHSHSAAAPRYRIVLPLSAEISHQLPAVEAVAEILGLSGVLDKSKLGASSVFYLPSAEPGRKADHYSGELEGKAIDAAWITAKARAILAERDRIQAEIRAHAMAEAEARRAAKIKAGFKPSENLIEGIRDRLDLAGELLKHGYEKVGDRFLYSGSETGIPGVHIMRGGDGVERVFSHHSGDPLAAGNLPPWCRTKAVDAVDVVTILDFGGDLKRALHELATRFGIGEPLKSKSPPEEPAGFDDVPPPDEAPEASQRRDDATDERLDAAFDRADDNRKKNAEWPSPVDFFVQERGGAPQLGIQHVPAAIWPFVLDTAERMGVDPFAVALPALVSLASVMSDDWAVQPRRFDTLWTENPRIWGAIVGDPSILKTPIISAATKPIDRLEMAARERHKQETREWKVADNQAKQDKTVSPPRPRLERHMIEGATTETIAEILRDDDEAKFKAPAKKLLSRHDEMSEFFGGLDRYRSGGTGSSDRGAYLRLYNGGRYTTDRIQRGSFDCANWSACFIGGCQPGPIQRIAREAADDGLLQRFIFCVPDAQRIGQDRQPNYDAAARYNALFPALVGLTPPAAFSGAPSHVVFHADAHQHREEIDNLKTVLEALPDTSARMKAVLGKWPGLFARLCLIFHLTETADGRAQGKDEPLAMLIPERIARQVAAFMREIILPHQIRAEALMFNTDQTGHAQWIAGLILSRKLERIQTRDVVQVYKPLRAPECRRDLEAVMASLVAVAWLDPLEPSNPVKPVSTWRVNPAVHVAFAERAAAEVKRRTDQRDLIAKAAAKKGTSPA